MRYAMHVGELLPGDPMFGIQLAGLTDVFLPARVRQQTLPGISTSTILGPTGRVSEAAKAVIDQAQQDAGSSALGPDMTGVEKQASTGMKVGILAIGVVGGLALMKLLSSKGVF